MAPPRPPPFQPPQPQTPPRAGRAPDRLARDLCELLLRRRLVFRCERQFKKPPPGAKKLVKFPRKLTRAAPADALSYADDAFYAWGYDRPPSKWTPVLTVLALVVVLLACLFPIAPASIKVRVGGGGGGGPQQPTPVPPVCAACTDPLPTRPERLPLVLNHAPLAGRVPPPTLPTHAHARRRLRCSTRRRGC